MSTAEELRAKRVKMYQNVYDSIVPERVPIDVSLNLNVVAEYAGIHGKEAYWNPDSLYEKADELCAMIPTDICLYGGSILWPSQYQALESNCMKLSQTGFMQHPNHVGMLPEDYDAFIENPLDCIVERILPRNYQGLNPQREDPLRTMLSIAVAQDAISKTRAKSGSVTSRLAAKYGYFTPEPGTGTGCYAPLDILTDTMRSLSGMSMDIRRRRDKVKAAVEAIYPLNYAVGIPPKITPYGHVFFPLHLATYMKEQDFVPLWWEPWLRQVTDYASMGLHSTAFCEHDWMRYLDYLKDLPTNTVLQFEQGDPKVIKETLGEKFILKGLFPLSTLRTCDTAECVRRTKEFLKIMMPGGKFLFAFDKNPLTLSDVSLDNLKAVCETVMEYGVYDNAGEQCGDVFRQEDYVHSEVPPIQSKYFRTWEQYLELNPNTPESAKAQVMASEMAWVKYVYGLCQ